MYGNMHSRISSDIALRLFNIAELMSFNLKNNRVNERNALNTDLGNRTSSISRYISDEKRENSGGIYEEQVAIVLEFRTRRREALGREREEEVVLAAIVIETLSFSLSLGYS